MKTKTLSAAFALAIVAWAAPAPAVAQESEPAVAGPRIIRTVEPVFPASLLPSHPKGGHARLVLELSSTGELADVLVTGYTARGFANEALWCAKRWRYEPARLHGQPIASQWELLMTFEPSGNMVSMTAIDSANELVNVGFQATDTYRPRRLDELDRPLTATNTVQPAYPAPLQQRGLKGEVTIDFFIDEQGNVRVPSLQESDHNELGAHAAAALRQWKFERPTVRGQPVLVKARQTFRFNPAATQEAGQ